MKYKLSNLISFELDKQLGLVIEYIGPKACFSEVQLTQDSRKELVKYLTQCLNSINPGIEEGTIFIQDQLSILGCSCAGGIYEHSLFILNIDGDVFIKMNLSDRLKTDGVLLGKNQINAFINSLL